MENTEGTKHPPNQTSVDVEKIQTLTLAEPVTKNTANFFQNGLSLFRFLKDPKD